MADEERIPEWQAHEHAALYERDWEGDFYKLLAGQYENDDSFRALCGVAAARMAIEDGTQPEAVDVDADEADEDEDDEFALVQFYMTPWKMTQVQEAYQHMQEHPCPWGTEVMAEFMAFCLRAMTETMEDE